MQNKKKIKFKGYTQIIEFQRVFEMDFPNH